MDDNELLDALQNQLNDVRNTKGILQIINFRPDGKHPRTFYSEVTDHHSRIRELPLFLFDDFEVISKNLVHFTSFLFLLRPYINDPTKEEGTYFQNWRDLRYLSYASVLHSEIYNFWDRIGDLLNCFFQTGLTDARVYMGLVLNNFPVTDKDSSYFEQLNRIFTEQVRPIVFDRNEDVHNQSIGTSYFYGTILARGDDQRQIAKRKLQMPDLFKVQIGLAYEGFELALRLIRERAPGRPVN